MSKYTDRIDMRFAYTPAAATDIRKSIAKEIKRLKEIAEREAKMPKAQVKQIREKKA